MNPAQCLPPHLLGRLAGIISNIMTSSSGVCVCCSTILSDDGTNDASHFVFTDVKMNFKIHKVYLLIH